MEDKNLLSEMGENHLFKICILVKLKNNVLSFVILVKNVFYPKNSKNNLSSLYSVQKYITLTHEAE